MDFIVNAEVLTCPNGDCGISFAVPDWWCQGKRETGKTFYCPNGHPQSFTEREIDRVRRERDRAVQEQARLQQELNSEERKRIDAEKRERKLKKRAAAGTCPCCQRTFQNMATHLKREHPGFVKDTGANVVPIKKPA